MADELNRPDEKPVALDSEEGEPPLLTKEEAIAEVKRWIERHQIDPSQLFARIGELNIRYGDLIPHLEQETNEGRLLLRAISRGRVVRQQRGVPSSLDRGQKLWASDGTDTTV